jgi:hypothetical protein
MTVIATASDARKDAAAPDRPGNPLPEADAMRTRLLAPVVLVAATALAALRERIRTDRKGLVAQHLPLTEAEAKAFWRVYERCHESIESAQRKVYRAIVDCVGAESRITDARAKQLVSELLEADADAVRARKACFERVAKVLPGRKAARYFQIENKMAALARFDVAATLPLVP